MKRFLAFFFAVLTAILLPSCSSSQDDWDVYQYDGYLNVRWGMTPDEAVRALGINRSQIERIAQLPLDHLPEGTFGYELTKYVSRQGTRIRTYLYFAENLYDLPQYVGLYAVQQVYEEGIYNTTNDRVGEEMNGEEIIDELWKRALYNTQYSEITLPDGSLQYRQYCKNTPSTIGGEKEPRLAEIISDQSFPFSFVADGGIENQPLSTLRFTYNSEEECSSILYEGYLAALLRNIDNLTEE